MDNQLNRYAKAIDKLGFEIDVRSQQFDNYYFYLIDKKTGKRITKEKNKEEYFAYHDKFEVYRRITNKKLVKLAKPYWVIKSLFATAIEYRRNEKLPPDSAYCCIEMRETA